jgi:hypothetical protein
MIVGVKSKTKSVTMGRIFALKRQEWPQRGIIPEFRGPRLGGTGASPRRYHRPSIEVRDWRL